MCKYFAFASNVPNLKDAVNAKYENGQNVK
jgi:hypothetical protein